MENYTKYKLKSSDELASVLDGKDNLFVIACNKCFKEFETVDEPDCDEFLKFAADQGKNVTGSAKFDFLCNKMHTERKLQDLIPEGTENVVVISCGLGIQTVADLAGKPVVAASNTLNYRGHHGMALTKKSCDACAQCYLNITGGVCPIVDCSKSLVNGQCGGAKNGKCEVDPNKDCAWEKIYQRLAKQGRLEEFLNQPVQVRDFSKVNFKVINDYVKSIRDDRLNGYYGGVHPSERKELSEHIALKRFPEPKTLVISMSQHLGAPANPIVQVGDTVKVGQKIGEAAGFISAPVHSSVSGTVVAVEPRMHGTRGSEVMAVVIESDGKNTLHESVQPHGDLDTLTPDEIIDIIREAGIVGMGGAGFPTCVKLKPAKPVDTILLNGCECEPLLTADHRVLLEYADDIIFGLKAVLKTTGAEKGIIVIEDNKQDAIELMQEKVANIGNMDDLNSVLYYGAAGIGLLRSEFQYLGRENYPRENELFLAYKKIAETMGEKLTVIRTADLGADKQAEYLNIPDETNPIIGNRGIRLCLDRKRMFKAQLRAIFRASAYGNLALMYPMISSEEEMDEIEEIIREVKIGLDEKGIPYKHIKTGIMIETPAAVMISRELARRVDFLSLGTNDLSQYTLAMDRQNPLLRKKYNDHHPAVLRMIQMVIEAGHAENRRVCICGELAADTALTEEFLRMGVDCLSVVPACILPVRKALRQVDLSGDDKGA